jgi:murein DD-endopeptidase MepM/ murein hydrolase activator NlpD
MNWPLLGPPIGGGLAVATSGYTDRRTVGSSEGIHGALDFSVPRGTPVIAVADGIVKDASPTERQHTGRYVLLEHQFPGGLRLMSRSIHLERVMPLQIGQRVRKGQTIGSVGSSGNPRYSPHLHFDLRICGLGALAAYKATFGWPTTDKRPVLVATPGCHIVPAEPLVRVDGYAPRVTKAAKAFQIPLASERRTPPASGDGPLVLLVATAFLASAAAGVYYLWSERVHG